MRENCKKLLDQMHHLREKHAEFRQAYADALKFAAQNPHIRETSFTRCRELFYEIKTLVLELHEDFPRLTKEQKELITFLETDYAKMRGTLERYEISTKGMPTWEQVKKSLTPNVLYKALKLTDPTLLLVPPTTRQSKVEAINKHPAMGQKYDTFTKELSDNNLWNGGNAQTENKWRVSIVEGAQDVAQDAKIYDGKRTNYEMSKLWVEKYEKEGLDVMNDSDAYLTLMMKGLAEGKPIDPATYTVLNGKNLTNASDVARGNWYNAQVYLLRGIPAFVRNFLRLRGSVGVDVQ